MSAYRMDKAAATPLEEHGAIRNFVSEINRKVFEKHTDGSHPSTAANFSGGENDENVPGAINQRRNMLDTYKSKHKFVPVSPARSRRQGRTVTNFVLPTQASARQKDCGQELSLKSVRRQKNKILSSSAKKGTSTASFQTRNQYNGTSAQSSSSDSSRAQKVHFSVKDEGHLNYSARRHRQQRQGKGTLAHEASLPIFDQHMTNVDNGANRPGKVHHLDSASLFHHIHAPVGHSANPKKKCAETLRKYESKFTAYLTKPPGLGNTENATVHGHTQEKKPSCGLDTDFSTTTSILRDEPQNQKKHHDALKNSPGTTDEQLQRSNKPGRVSFTDGRDGVQLGQSLEEKLMGVEKLTDDVKAALQSKMQRSEAKFMQLQHDNESMSKEMCTLRTANQQLTHQVYELQRQLLHDQLAVHSSELSTTTAKDVDQLVSSGIHSKQTEEQLIRAQQRILMLEKRVLQQDAKRKAEATEHATLAAKLTDRCQRYRTERNQARMYATDAAKKVREETSVQTMEAMEASMAATLRARAIQENHCRTQSHHEKLNLQLRLQSVEHQVSCVTSALKKERQLHMDDMFAFEAKAAALARNAASWKKHGDVVMKEASEQLAMMQIEQEAAVSAQKMAETELMQMQHAVKKQIDEIQTKRRFQIVVVEAAARARFNRKIASMTTKADAQMKKAVSVLQAQHMETREDLARAHAVAEQQLQQLRGRLLMAEANATKANAAAKAARKEVVAATTQAKNNCDSVQNAMQMLCSLRNAIVASRGETTLSVPLKAVPQLLDVHRPQTASGSESLVDQVATLCTDFLECQKSAIVHKTAAENQQHACAQAVEQQLRTDIHKAQCSETDMQQCIFMLRTELHDETLEVAETKRKLLAAQADLRNLEEAANARFVASKQQAEVILRQSHDEWCRQASAIASAHIDGIEAELVRARAEVAEMAESRAESEVALSTQAKKFSNESAELEAALADMSRVAQQEQAIALKLQNQEHLEIVRLQADKNRLTQDIETTTTESCRLKHELACQREAQQQRLDSVNAEANFANAKVNELESIIEKLQEAQQKLPQLQQDTQAAEGQLEAFEREVEEMLDVCLAPTGPLMMSAPNTPAALWRKLPSQPLHLKSSKHATEPVRCRIDLSAMGPDDQPADTPSPKQRDENSPDIRIKCVWQNSVSPKAQRTSKLWSCSHSSITGREISMDESDLVNHFANPNIPLVSSSPFASSHGDLKRRLSAVVERANLLRKKNRALKQASKSLAKEVAVSVDTRAEQTAAIAALTDQLEAAEVACTTAKQLHQQEISAAVKKIADLEERFCMEAEAAQRIRLKNKQLVQALQSKEQVIQSQTQKLQRSETCSATAARRRTALENERRTLRQQLATQQEAHASVLSHERRTREMVEASLAEDLASAEKFLPTLREKVHHLHASHQIMLEKAGRLENENTTLQQNNQQAWAKAQHLLGRNTQLEQLARNLENNLETEAGKRVADLSSFRDALHDAQQEAADAAVAQEALEATNQRLEARESTLRAELDLETQAAQHCAAQARFAEETCEELYSAIAALRADEAASQQELFRIGEAGMLMKEELAKVKAAYDCLKARTDQAAAEHCNLSHNNKALQKEAGEMKVTAAFLEVDNESLTATVELLRKQQKELENTMSTSLEMQTIASEEAECTLRTELETAVNVKNGLLAQTETLQTHVANLENQKTLGQEQFDEAMDTAARQLREASDARQLMLNTEAKLQVAVQNTEAKACHLENLMDTKDHEVEVLQQHTATLKQELVASKQRLAAEKKQFVGALTAAAGEIADVQAAQDQLTEELNNARDELHNVRAQLGKELNATQDQLRAEQTTSLELELARTALLNEFQAAVLEAEAQKAQHVQAEAQCEEFATQIASLSSAGSELDSVVAELQSTIHDQMRAETELKTLHNRDFAAQQRRISALQTAHKRDIANFQQEHAAAAADHKKSVTELETRIAVLQGHLMKQQPEQEAATFLAAIASMEMQKVESSTADAFDCLRPVAVDASGVDDVNVADTAKRTVVLQPLRITSSNSEAGMNNVNNELDDDSISSSSDSGEVSSDDTNSNTSSDFSQDSESIPQYLDSSSPIVSWGKSVMQSAANSPAQSPTVTPQKAQPRRSSTAPRTPIMSLAMRMNPMMVRGDLFWQKW
eukprot:INCI17614.2.p1 GENE.INCI17614.2~~INCI17614.2.p1  ORF type:complete len:2161 (-),score=566.84 INCI17614.2:414-6896(-)